MDKLVSDTVREALGASLVWEDWRGDLRRAQALVDTEPASPLARAIVLTVRGQAGAASRVVDDVLQATTEEPARAIALGIRRFVQHVALHHVPGGDGGSDAYLRAAWSAVGLDNTIPGPQPRPLGDSVRRDLSAVRLVGSVLTARTTMSIGGRRREAFVRENVAGYVDSVDGDATDLATECDRSCSAIWPELAAADLFRRAGNDQHAYDRLARAAKLAETDQDAIAMGQVALVRGDWAATELESPSTLGLALEGSDQADSFIDDRVEASEWRVDAARARRAAESYDVAARYFEQGAAPRGLAAVVLSRAGAAAMAGEHPTARLLALQAERAFDRTGDELGRRLARTHAAVAATATRDPIDLASIREIGAWGRGDGSPSFAIGCARLLSRSGRRALYADGDVERAVALHRLAAELLDALNAGVLVAQSLVDRAGAYQAANEVEAATTYLELASDRLTAGDTGVDATASVTRQMWILQRAWQLQLSGRNPDALERIARRAQAVLARTTGFSFELLGAHAVLTMVVQQAASLVPLYRARERAEDPSVVDRDAIEASWQRALEAARQGRGLEPLLQQALVAAERDDDRTAEQLAARYFDGNGFLSQLGPAVAMMPPAQVAQARLAQARQAFGFFVRVRAAARARAALDQLAALDASWWQRGQTPWAELADVAELHAMEGDLDTARTMYQQAIELLENQRQLLSEDSLKRRFVDSVPAHRMYVGAARAALAADPARAFEQLERGRARALLDLVVDPHRGAAGDDPIVAWRAHNARRSVYQSMLAIEADRTPPSPERVAELRAKLAACETEIAGLATQLGDRALLNPTASVASLASVTAALPAGTVILQYAFADGFLVAWAIDRTDMTASRVTRTAAHQLRRAARGFHLACSERTDVAAAGAMLGELLLEPFADEIRAASHVVVIPTDALHLVAFHALPFGGRLLADTVTVSYAPSASLVIRLGRGPIEGAGLLAIGNPTAMSCVTGDGASRPLRSLPGAGVEARRIAASYPCGLALIGDRATAAALQDSIAKVGILHLATHGVVSPRSPWLSTIALASGAALDLATLSSWHISADLVALSACDTARGEAGSGDEVLGFARGLLAAGARRTLVSLWPVSDVATCALMTELYRRLAAGAPVASALRDAQNHVRRMPPDAVRAFHAQLVADDAAIGGDTRRDAAPEDPTPLGDSFDHPSFWAPFVLLGL